MQKAGIYNGRFFVLNGLLPITTKQNIQKIHLEELLNEVKRATERNGLKEIILGLSLNPEGEHTTNFIKTKLEPFIKNGLKISELGRGLSTGAELEYMDSNTLKNALGTRT